MLCMKCFSEASLETRLHCVDIDIAYEQRKKSLDLAISVISSLHTVIYGHRLVYKFRSN